MSATSVEILCKRYLRRYLKDCSGFVKAVARALHVGGLEGRNATQICNYLYRAPHFEFVGRGLHGLREASALAREGYLVIAGSKAPRGHHGHVAIVTGDEWGYWGSSGGHPSGINGAPIVRSWATYYRNQRFNRVCFFATTRRVYAMVGGSAGSDDPDAYLDGWSRLQAELFPPADDYAEYPDPPPGRRQVHSRHQPSHRSSKSEVGAFGF